jgi:uroporphyrinogen decarboxylase
MSDLFLRACRREPVERPPLWIMRQAGRYLPEYRAIRERVDFMTLCRTPELAAEVTLQPIARFGFDAAILFSDILVLAEPLGLEVDFRPGPVVATPLRSVEAIDRLEIKPPEASIPWVYEAARLVRHELDPRVPLIGFAAAPFTLAAYLIEGGGSRLFESAKRLLWAEPQAAHRLLQRLADLTVQHLTAQVRAGAQAVQLFDTWAGLLDRQLYTEFALRWTQYVVAGLAHLAVPRIYFALDAAHLLPDVRRCGAEVIGVDWRTALDVAAHELGANVALQGNLDPCALLAGPEATVRAAQSVLDRGRALPGHVFNLGHGILPTTPLSSVEALVELVHAERRPLAATLPA